MKITHPVGKKRIAFHFLLGNIAGTDGAAAVGKQDIKIASVIAYLKNRMVFRNILFSDHSDPGSCAPQDEFKYGLYHAQGTDILGHGRKFPDDPFYQENGDSQNQISDHHDTDKYKSNHIFCPFCF